MINYLKRIHIVLLVFSIVIGFAILKTIKYRNLRNTGAKVEGKVYRGYRNITWEYVVNSNTYKVSVSRSDYPFIIDGEEYYVYYNTSNPSSSLMSFTEPIIDSMKFDTTLSLPLSLNFSKGTQLIKFSYKIGEKVLVREHLYKFESDLTSFNQKYVIYIKKDNPQISYIKIEQ